ncbi:hypothetical protein [Geodermatophilus sp. SYSU D01105]
MGGIAGGDSGPAAPQVVISWSHASNAGRGLEDRAAQRAADEAWRDEVLEFFVALRRLGIDADIDLAHFSERGVDWTRWGPRMVRERDVIAVVNAGWRRAWEESGDGRTGRGAAAEVDVLLSMFNEDRDAFQKKVVPVLLPSCDDSDVPYGLDRLPRVRVPAFDDDGMTPLLRILTNQPEYPVPSLGAIPLLPPAASAGIQRRLDHPAAVGGSAAAHDQVGITDSVTVEHVRGGAEEDRDTTEAELRDEIALLRSALRQVPQPGPGEGPHLPWYRTWEQLQLQLAGLQRQLADLETVPAASGSAPSSQDQLRLASLLDGLAAEVERNNRCWLLLAAIPTGSRLAAQVSGRTTVEQRREQLTRWRERSAPVVLLDWSTQAVRRPGRVTFTGESLHGPAPSTRWRVELLDDGSAVVAAAVSEPPAIDTPGFVSWSGQPGETVRDAAIFLPVRRDLLEIWMLTAVELALDHARHDGEPIDAMVLQAQVMLPTDLAIPGVHDPRQLGVRIVEEVRDEDEHRLGDRPVPGGYDLPLGSTPPTATELVELPAAEDPRAVVQTARHLAGGLLEYFGVEGTALLRADNTVDAFAAAEGDQQVTHQHARAVGLPVDPRSPAERRRRYEEMVVEARAQLRPD